MKINTLTVNQEKSLSQYFKDIQSPEMTRYALNLKKEAPNLAQKVGSLNQKQLQDFNQHFLTTLNTLDPMTKNMLIGGAAGGALGTGFSLIALSVKDIGKLFGHPILFSIGVGVLGVVAGALTPQILNHFSESKANFTMRTPKWWDAILPNMELKFEGVHEE